MANVFSQLLVPAPIHPPPPHSPFLRMQPLSPEQHSALSRVLPSGSHSALAEYHEASAARRPAALDSSGRQLFATATPVSHRSRLKATPLRDFVDPPSLAKYTPSHPNPLPNPSPRPLHSDPYSVNPYRASEKRQELVDHNPLKVRYHEPATIGRLKVPPPTEPTAYNPLSPSAPPLPPHPSRSSPPPQTSPNPQSPEPAGRASPTSFHDAHAPFQSSERRNIFPHEDRPHTARARDRANTNSTADLLSPAPLPPPSSQATTSAKPIPGWMRSSQMSERLAMSVPPSAADSPPPSPGGKAHVPPSPPRQRTPSFKKTLPPPAVAAVPSLMQGDYPDIKDDTGAPSSFWEQRPMKKISGRGASQITL